MREINIELDKRKQGRLKWLPLFLIFTFSHFLIFSCSNDPEHAPAVIHENDSILFMRSRGISTLISDSGVIRYKLVTEEWDILTNTNPPSWRFLKGLLMERFDEGFHIDLHVEADTAYLHEQHLWELRGRVVIHNIEGTLFRTEELFWDMNEHRMWSDQYMRIKTPDKELEGTTFRSNEQMTDYYVSNSRGAFPVSDVENEEEEVPKDTAAAVAATTSKRNNVLTPAGQKAGKVMPTAPNKQGHWK